MNKRNQLKDIEIMEERINLGNMQSTNKKKKLHWLLLITVLLLIALGTKFSMQNKMLGFIFQLIALAIIPFTIFYIINTNAYTQQARANIKHGNKKIIQNHSTSKIEIDSPIKTGFLFAIGLLLGLLFLWLIFTLITTIISIAILKSFLSKLPFFS